VYEEVNEDLDKEEKTMMTNDKPKIIKTEKLLPSTVRPDSPHPFLTNEDIEDEEARNDIVS
jgi:hypothetical protein